MFGLKLYQSAPIIIQSCLISARALVRKKLRENKHTAELTESLLGLERSDSALEKYRQEKLDSVLISARKNTSAYANTPLSIENFEFVNKESLLTNSAAFLNKSHSGVVIKGSTSGTTGTPLSIPQNMESVLTEQAFTSRYLKWAGFKEGDRRAWIRGDLIVPIKQTQSPFWRYSYFEDMILLSSFHMSRDALPQYIQAMVSYGVDIIQALPSSIVMLAKYLESVDKYYPETLKSVITSSESLSWEDKQLIEKRFKCMVFDWYGLFERVAAIGSCEYGRYHILTDYSHVELLPAGIVDGKQRAEIVGTNFNNSLYPLIRYKTGDHVILSDEISCPCGRVYPMVESIEGRTSSYLIAANNQKVYSVSHISKGVAGLLSCQFIQKSRGEITILVVIDHRFIASEEKKLIASAQLRLGDIVVIIEKVTSVPRTKNGKVRQAICLIKD